MSELKTGTPRPVRENYAIKDTIKKETENSKVKQLFEYAARGQTQLLRILLEIPWTNLTDKEFLAVICFIISYGLKTNKPLFEPLVRKDITKSSSTSLLQSLCSCNKINIKRILESESFTAAFEALFVSTNINWRKILNSIVARVALINENQIDGNTYAHINALVNSITSGVDTTPKVLISQ